MKSLAGNRRVSGVVLVGHETAGNFCRLFLTLLFHICPLSLPVGNCYIPLDDIIVFVLSPHLSHGLELLGGEN